MSKSSILIIISVAALSMLYTVHGKPDKAASKMLNNIRNLYRRFGDINKVIVYWKRQNQMFFHLVMRALLTLMQEFGHTDDVIHCITVYEVVMLSYYPKIGKKPKENLDDIQKTLINDLIIPNAALQLGQMHSSNVSKLLDWIKTDTRGFADQILNRYWDSVRTKSQNPVADYASTSKEVRQNIYLVLFLYKKHKENRKYDMELLEQLKKLADLPDYEETVSQKVKDEVAKLLGNLGTDNTTRENTATTKGPTSEGDDTLELPGVDLSIINKMKDVYLNETTPNFQTALNYIDSIYESESRAEHLLALCHVMNRLNYTLDVIKAIPLHDAIERFLTEDGTQILLPTMMKLDKVKEMILNIVIYPQCLTAMVNNHHSKDRLTKILDLIYNTTDTLAEHIIGQYWDIIDDNKDVDPVQRASKVSPYLRQNVYMILMLYNMNKFTDKKLGVLHEVLKLIMLNPDYRATVPNEHRRQIEKIYSLTANYEIMVNVIRIYAENFDNYHEVIEYMDAAKGTDRKGYIVISLYEVMKASHHLNELFRALTLYKTVEERINSRPHQLEKNQLKKLNEIRAELLTVVVEDGYRILDNAVKEGRSSTVVIKLLEALNMLGNRTILNETLGKVWGKLVQSTSHPLANILQIVETLQQKIELLLALLGLDNLSYPHMISIIDELAKLQKTKDYERLPDDLKAQVERAITKVWFMRKLVSIYQEVGGAVRYLQQCTDTDEQACVSESKNLRRIFLPYTTRESKIKLGIPHFRNHLCLRNSITATGGKTYNVFTRSTESDNFYWLADINHDDNTVIFSDEKKEQYLCSDISDTKAFTRNKKSFEANQNACKWKVEVWV